MAIKKIYTYKGMHKYAQNHYTSFGWHRSPKTRFEALPRLLELVIPEIALFFATVHHRFDFKWVFIDKSVFRSLGGITKSELLSVIKAIFQATLLNYYIKPIEYFYKPIKSLPNLVAMRLQNGIMTLLKLLRLGFCTNLENQV